MKVTLFSTLTILCSLSLTTHAVELKSADNSQFTRLCMQVLQGNKAALHAYLKDTGYSRSYVASKVTCNGENVLSFAQKYGKNADQIVDMLDRRRANVSITDIAKVAH